MMVSFDILIGINIQQASPRSRIPKDMNCCSPLSDQRLSKPNTEQLAVGFAALSDPIRLKVFNIIASAPTEEVCACNLVKPVGRSQPTVSHHLKVLREAGLITSTKRGTWVWYRINAERLSELRDVLR
jgi:ArsR family transcriptional regulator